MHAVRKAFLFMICTVVACMLTAPSWAQDLDAVKRGEYIFNAAGGCGCHTDRKNKGPFMAGGRPIATPYGTIYSTNITPDPETGIGKWNDEQFIASMTRGVGPEGQHYFPVFPYTSFTKMTRRDLLDLKAYLLSIPAVKKPNKSLQLMPPFGWRWTLGIWKSMYFSAGVFQPDADQSAEWNRGAYLATAVAHCGECHTPRNLMGGLKHDMYYAGSLKGPEGELAPNITPDEATGIGDWSIEDIVWLLQTGLNRDGNDVQGLMSELIEHGYAKLSEADLRAIAVYVKSVKPVHNKVEAKKDAAE